jgi:hypothetical protein
MDASLKIYALLASVSSTQLITSWAESRLFDSVRFSKLVQFHIYPRLNIFTLPEWLSVKFHCFLISSKVKILNAVTPFGSHLCNVVSSVVTRVNSLNASY